MPSDNDYKARGISPRLLGVNWRQWNNDDIRKIVAYYKGYPDDRPSKMELFERLQDIVEEYELKPRHGLLLRAAILGPYEQVITGVPVPRRCHRPYERNPDVSDWGSIAYFTTCILI